MSTRSRMIVKRADGLSAVAERGYGNTSESGSLTRYLADQAQHAIERADTKASTLAATATAIVAILAQRDGLSAHGPWAALLLGAGALVWAAGIALLATAIFPRFGRSDAPRDRLVYFNDFPRSFDREALRALTGVSRADREQLMLAQAHALSRIAAVKFRLIRIGMLLLAAGGALGLAGVLIR